MTTFSLKTASNLLANNNSLPATIQKLKISSIQAKNNATNNKLGVYKDICNSTAAEIKNLKGNLTIFSHNANVVVRLKSILTGV